MNRQSVREFSYDLEEIAWKARIIDGAEKLGVSPALISIQQGSYPKYGVPDFWEEPIISSAIDSKASEGIRLVENKSLLSRLAWSISKTIQFPVNTVFAHSLGVVASAMSKSFQFKYGQSAKPVNLYVVTAQPPSTGKSGVNEILTEPVHAAFDAINQTAIIERKRLKIEIDRTKKEAKSAKSKEEQFALEDELTKLYERLKNHVVYTYVLDDATPEATAKIALNQNGIFNIISAEADAINVILGGVYSERKSNYGIFLKGWDSERHHIARANQEVISGHVTGCLAVIAQDESIKTILEAGESGRGISERLLLVREPTFLGRRSFDTPIPLDDELLEKYSKTIFNIVREKGVTLEFNQESINVINEFRRDLEPELSDEGKYSNNMMRGFIGKSDKQIMKIASILHTIENWQSNGKKSTDIEVSTVKSAINIFNNFIQAYVSSADQLGFTGNESEYEKVEERLQSYAEKGKLVVSISQLRSSIKGVKPFSNTPNITNKLKNILLPVMENYNICLVHEGKIYINPKLKC